MQRSKSAAFISVHKPGAYARVSVYTGRKKLVGVAMGLYTGETIDGWAC